MTASLNTLRTSHTCGYSVMINAPKWLTEEVENIQYELVGSQSVIKDESTVFQIPLVNLLSAETTYSEERVLQSVEKIASMIHCFQVSYTGFSFFNTENAFRINVEEQDVLISLRDLLQGELQPYQLLSNTAKPTFATGQTRGSEGMHYEFINEAVTNNFRVNSLSILKKVVGNNDWELLKEVPFGRA